MKIITIEELEKLKLEDKIIFADFYAEWCGPCRTLATTIESFYRNYKNVEFVKIDIETCRDLMAEYTIRNIPTVIIFKGSEIIDKSSGINNVRYYKEILNKIK